MRALVVYESMFGNTRDIAQAVAAGLRTSIATDLVEVGAAPTSLDADVSLLVVGGPTHAFSLSRPKTREDAAARTGRALGSAGTGLREWLPLVGPVPGTVAAAAFDTKVDKPWLPGSAARAAHKLLRRMKYRTMSSPESFFVTDTTGPLVDGELERARAWGERLGAAAAAGDRPAGMGAA